MVLHKASNWSEFQLPKTWKNGLVFLVLAATGAVHLIVQMSQVGVPSASPLDKLPSIMDPPQQDVPRNIQQREKDTTITVPQSVRTAIQFCQHNNYVALRDERPIEAHVPSTQDARPFSIPEQAFLQNYSSKKMCASVNETLHAIQHGTRHWVNRSIEKETDDLIREAHPSYFVPNGCHIPVREKARIMKILQHIPTVIVIGDSLSRHFNVAFLSTVREDLIRGWSRYAVDPIMNHSCYCDGQFAGHLACRTRIQNQSFPEVENVRVQLSSNVVYQHMRLYGHENPTEMTALLPHGMNCSKIQGDILLILQGGMHFRMDAGKTYAKMRSLLNQPAFLDCAAKHKILFIFLSVDTFSPKSVQRFPRQSPVNAHKFNGEIQGFFARNGHVNMTFIDWMAMTKNAQTSDGVHKLLDVNYFKTQYVLHVAHLMQREQRYYTRQLELYPELQKLVQQNTT